MKKRTILASILLILATTFGTLSICMQNASAAFNPDDSKNGCPAGSLYKRKKGKPAEEVKTLADCNLPAESTQYDLMDKSNKIINVIVGIVGIVSVAVIVIGGIMYATSQGDPQKAKTAQHAILYGIVGLVVALLAFAIVNFVLSSVFTNPT